MKVVELVARIFKQDVPPAPPPERPLPTPEDIRWAQAERDALVRRAQVLGIDVELERAGR